VSPKKVPNFVDSPNSASLCGPQRSSAMLPEQPNELSRFNSESNAEIRRGPQRDAEIPGCIILVAEPAGAN